MATAVADREARKRRGWLRRVEPDLPLRLPLERLAPDKGQSLGSMLDIDNANGFTAAGLNLERPSHVPQGLSEGLARGRNKRERSCRLPNASSSSCSRPSKRCWNRAACSNGPVPS